MPRKSKEQELSRGPAYCRVCGYEVVEAVVKDPEVSWLCGEWYAADGKRRIAACPGCGAIPSRLTMMTERPQPGDNGSLAHKPLLDRLAQLPAPIRAEIWHELQNAVGRVEWELQAKGVSPC